MKVDALTAARVDWEAEPESDASKVWCPACDEHELPLRAVREQEVLP